MILAFSQINPKTKEPTGFVDKILTGKKIHTIRSGNRWRAGATIQMATGVRTEDYNQFNRGYPDLQMCRSTQTIQIRPAEEMNGSKIYVDGRLLNMDEAVTLAHNDGFPHLAAFWTWFNEDFDGQLVHWTDFKY
ncbi:hypothetical protein F0L74_10040 [Chitinophaga agrisoli]|uniref:ASCH domain-containing protein n=1 Tax=Chitinophaga agrisoli TaxID=2607653 RepID=A0A5B2VXV0_9BACT|nr:hypothetical protein [Chitinophaga agrisoli]KAA2242859.1 hypothetical protein F0L74_10040 [Chitinophaga agrisoli]